MIVNLCEIYEHLIRPGDTDRERDGYDRVIDTIADGLVTRLGDALPYLQVSYSGLRGEVHIHLDEGEVMELVGALLDDDTAPVEVP